MKWQEFVKDYLNFTRHERIGIIVIVAILILVIILPGIWPKPNNSVIQHSDTTWFAAIKKLEIKSTDKSDLNNDPTDGDANSYVYDRRPNSSSDFLKGELFLFDPNTISYDDWKKLGLKNKLIGTIQNYIKKGGHFYKSDDLQKIYGINKDEYERLAPYIRIESKREAKNFAKENLKQNEFQNTSSNTNSRYKVIDINSADTSDFISLPGIGSKLALRIINFRDKLGGFYSIDQVREIYGLQDSVFQKIKQYLKLENISIKKININTATLDELKTHPYIKYSLANPIVAYRNEHGLFSKIEDIKKVMTITEDVFIKIAPYLTIQ